LAWIPAKPAPAKAGAGMTRGAAFASTDPNANLGNRVY
jgi:hypothetical protein